MRYDSDISQVESRQIAYIYRERAHQALSLARIARGQGKLDAALGLADEALLWRAYASDWARRGTSHLS